MRLRQVIAVLAIGVLWMACGSETPVAPVEEEGSAGVLLETADEPLAVSASLESAATVMYFCYAPQTGNVYRIRHSDLPTECRTPNDVDFSWAGVDGHSLDAADGEPADALYVNDEGQVVIDNRLEVAAIEAELIDVGVVRVGAIEFPDGSRQTTTGRVAFKAARAGGETCPGLTNTVYPLVSFNDGDGYDASTGLFVAPMSGVYHFAATIDVAPHSYNTKVGLYLAVNGGPTSPATDGAALGEAVAGTSHGYGSGSVTVKLSQGDYVGIYLTSCDEYFSGTISGHLVYAD
jgi:hypothetical protein